MGSFKATPGNRSELASILLGDVGALPRCRSYIVAEDLSDADTLWITEVWDDAASHKASLALPAVKAAIARAMPLIESFGEHRELKVLGGLGT
jgi:quinol monooxygenase YgiN